MNTPIFNLNLSFVDEGDNLLNNLPVPDAKNIENTKRQQMNSDTSDLNQNAPDKQTSDDNVFTSFFNEFGYLDELFNSFDEDDKKGGQNDETQEEKHASRTPVQNHVDPDDRHNVLQEKDLNAFSAANTEKSTKYATTWAVKTFKGKSRSNIKYILKFFSFHALILNVREMT